jgi:hypothetical protein
MTAFDPYAGERIAYMNARRAAKAGTGGKSYATLANPVDERSRLAGLDPFQLIAERAFARIENSRAIVREFRNSLAAGLTAIDEIPF